MAATRSRDGQRTPARPVLTAAWALWSLALFFIVAGLAMVFFGVIFGLVGAKQVLQPGAAVGFAVAAIFTMLGLAAVVAGGTLVFWLRPKLVLKLSGRKAPSLFGSSGGGFCGGGDGGGGGRSC